MAAAPPVNRNHLPGSCRSHSVPRVPAQELWPRLVKECLRWEKCYFLMWPFILLSNTHCTGSNQWKGVPPLTWGQLYVQGPCTIHDTSCFQTCTELWRGCMWKCKCPVTGQPPSMKSRGCLSEPLWEHSRGSSTGLTDDVVSNTWQKQNWKIEYLSIYLSSIRVYAIHTEETEEDVERSFGDKGRCQCLKHEIFYSGINTLLPASACLTSAHLKPLEMSGLFLGCVWAENLLLHFACLSSCLKTASVRCTFLIHSLMLAL